MAGPVLKETVKKPVKAAIDLTKPNNEEGVYDKVNKRISYQKIDDPRLARNAAINHIFKEAWILRCV